MPEFFTPLGELCPAIPARIAIISVCEAIYALRLHPRPIGLGVIEIKISPSRCRVTLSLPYSILSRISPIITKNRGISGVYK